MRALASAEAVKTDSVGAEHCGSDLALMVWFADDSPPGFQMRAFESVQAVATDWPSKLQAAKLPLAGGKRRSGFWLARSPGTIFTFTERSECEPE